jgi:hypothetical protein
MKKLLKKLFKRKERLNPRVEMTMWEYIHGKKAMLNKQNKV